MAWSKYWAGNNGDSKNNDDDNDASDEITQYGGGHDNDNDRDGYHEQEAMRIRAGCERGAEEFLVQGLLGSLQESGALVVDPAQ